MRSERAATPRPRLASPPFPPPSPQTAFGAANAEYVAAYKALQAKYHTVYSDLWRKRADIVSGAAGAAPADGAATASKGIEGFWLQALQNGRRTGATIEEHDEPVLKFLTDVRLAYLDDFTGFRLEFVFAPNPYFTNAQLDKTFHIPFMMGGGRLGSDPTIEKIVGCEINWLPGKNVTEKEVKKSQKKKGKKMTIVKKVGERRARRGRRGDESTVLDRGREHRACHMPFHAPALHPAPFFFSRHFLLSALRCRSPSSPSSASSARPTWTRTPTRTWSRRRFTS